jgi:hypothetical protein
VAETGVGPGFMFGTLNLDALYTLAELPEQACTHGATRAMTTHPPMNQFAWLAPLPSDERPVTP